MPFAVAIIAFISIPSVQSFWEIWKIHHLNRKGFISNRWPTPTEPYAQFFNLFKQQTHVWANASIACVVCKL